MRRVGLWLGEVLAIAAIASAGWWVSRTLLTPVRVGGWSMSPALVPGDVVFVRVGARPVPGDVVLVHANGHAPVLHRVVALLDGGAVRTKGDANAVDDIDPARKEELRGVAVGVLPLGSWRLGGEGRRPALP